MFFLVSKIYMDTELSDCDPQQLRKSVARLCKQFDVTAKAGFEQGQEDEPFVAVTAIGPTEEHLNKKIADMTAYLEDDGAGRVLMDHTIIESIDIVDDDESEESR